MQYPSNMAISNANRLSTGTGRTAEQMQTYMCKSTAAKAVDDMQKRMDVARIRNGKRPTGGGGATHTKGRTKADHHTEGRIKRPTGGRRGTHTGNTQTIRST